MSGCLSASGGPSSAIDFVAHSIGFEHKNTSQIVHRRTGRVSCIHEERHVHNSGTKRKSTQQKTYCGEGSEIRPIENSHTRNMIPLRHSKTCRYGKQPYQKFQYAITSELGNLTRPLAQNADPLKNKSVHTQRLGTSAP